MDGTANPRQRPTWEQHAENIAYAAALRSEDPYCAVGACVLSSFDTGAIVLGVGYNGTVRGVELDWEDRQARRPYIIHAEANALRYTTPALAQNGFLAVTHFPCQPCVLLAASYGIAAISWNLAPDWDTYPGEPVLEMARKLGINLIYTGDVR